MNIKLFKSCCVMVSMIWSTGCGGGDDLPRERVVGTVTLDGKPLASGLIQFRPSAGAGLSGATAVSGGAAIKEGSFEIPRDSGLTPGKYIVSISSTTEQAQATDLPPGVSSKPATELIPAVYNEKSTLTAEIKSGGGKPLAYELSSK